MQVPYQAYTVQDLQNVVNFQVQKLRAAGAGARAPVAPQSMLALSEQHWNANGRQSSECNCSLSPYCQCQITPPTPSVSR